MNVLKSVDGSHVKIVIARTTDERGACEMLIRMLVIVLAFGGVGFVHAQDEPASKPDAETPVAEKPDEKKQEVAEPTTAEKLKEKAVEKAVEWESATAEEVSKIAKQVDQDPRAKTAAAGILQPIYVVAESLAFPAFHWLAFSLMAAGVVSYALQLVLGKLVVLTRLGLSLKEIASDAVGLAISVVGLVLTTQAAAQNSTFTQSPFAVISASVVGAVVGFVLYLWGQSQELQAVVGRSHTQPEASPKK
jgi:hypothetical protein